MFSLLIKYLHTTLIVHKYSLETLFQHKIHRCFKLKTMPKRPFREIKEKSLRGENIITHSTSFEYKLKHNFHHRLILSKNTTPTTVSKQKIYNTLTSKSLTHWTGWWDRSARSKSRSSFAWITPSHPYFKLWLIIPSYNILLINQKIVKKETEYK